MSRRESRGDRVSRRVWGVNGSSFTKMSWVEHRKFRYFCTQTMGPTRGSKFWTQSWHNYILPDSVPDSIKNMEYLSSLPCTDPGTTQECLLRRCSTQGPCLWTPSCGCPYRCCWTRRPRRRRETHRSGGRRSRCGGGTQKGTARGKVEVKVGILPFSLPTHG